MGKLHKYRAKVFIDEHPKDKNTDDMTIHSRYDAATVKRVVKEILGEALSFCKLDENQTTIQ
jgi:hypothetical protein